MWNHDQRVVTFSGLATGARCDACGDGSHRRVLEAGMAHPGRAVSTAAGEPGTSKGAAWPENGSEGWGTDRGFFAAWITARQFCAAPTDSTVAGSDPRADDVDPGAGTDRESDSEGVGRRQYQTEQRDGGRAGGFRTADATSDDCRNHRAGSIGGVGAGQAAGKDSEVGAGGARQSERASSFFVEAMDGGMGRTGDANRGIRATDRGTDSPFRGGGEDLGEPAGD